MFTGWPENIGLVHLFLVKRSEEPVSGWFLEEEAKASHNCLRDASAGHLRPGSPPPPGSKR